MFDVSPLRSNEQHEFDASFAADVDEPRVRRTVAARRDGAVCGIASAVWSNRHPDVGFATIEWSGQWPGKLAADLIGALEAHSCGPLLFNFSMQRSDLAGALAAAGYQRVVESTTVRISVAEALRVLPSSPAMPQFDMALGPLSSEVVDLYEVLYAETHAWAGSYSPPSDQPWIHLVGPTVPGTVAVARDSDGPVTATSIHTGDFAAGADGFVAPTAVLDRARSGSDRHVVAELLRRSLMGAAAAGLTTVNVEYDTVHHELRAALASCAGIVTAELQGWRRPPA